MFFFTAEYSFPDIIFFPLYLIGWIILHWLDRALLVVTNVTKFEDCMWWLHTFLSWIPVIPSPAIYLYTVKIVFSWIPHLNHYKHYREGLCSVKSCGGSLSFSFLSPRGTTYFHTFHQLFFTRLFPTHLIKLNLQVFYKAYCHCLELFCKLTYLPIFIPIRLYILLNC